MENNVGGILGLNDEKRNNFKCFCVEFSVSVKGNSNVGKAIGENKGNVTNLSDLTSMSGSGHSNYIDQNITPEQAMQESTYEGFDLTTTWGIEEGKTIPYLVFDPQKNDLQSN